VQRSVVMFIPKRYLNSSELKACRKVIQCNTSSKFLSTHHFLVALDKCLLNELNVIITHTFCVVAASHTLR